MVEAFFFLGIGLALLVTLALWVQRSGAPVLEPQTVSHVQELLTAVHLDLPPRNVGERIFARSDWQFVVSQTAPSIQRRFLNDRKAVALSWLAETRMGLQKLMRFHRKAVRGNANLSPAMEIRLALGYFSFVLVCDLLRAFIWFRGPFAAQRVVGYAFGMADQVSYLSGHVLAGLDPMHLSRIQSRWASKPAA
jgi:hypothetical protein